MREYKIVLNVKVLTDWANIKDFTETEIDLFNQANKTEIEVEVEKVEEEG